MVWGRRLGLLLRSPRLASAFAVVAPNHPLAGHNGGQGEIRETYYSPREHLQKQDSCFLFAFSAVAGAQRLADERKAHFAGPSLSFYVIEQKELPTTA